MSNNPKLICFTYAGGNTGFFGEIEKDLTGIDLIKPEYAGHASRHNESFYNDFDELADDLFNLIKDNLDGKYALFGYSMGSITLAEVLRRIIREGANQPSYVCMAAHEPHTKSELLGYTSDELDEWVKNRTIKFGGVPERLLNNPVYWRTYLPLYRADYTIIGKYEFEKLDLETDIPATIFYSEKDTPFSDMKQWKRYFVGQVDFVEFDGTHFFIREHHKEMADVIRGRLII